MLHDVGALDIVLTTSTVRRYAAAMTEHVDVLIVGAGISGIGAAYHVQDALPGRRYAILEARERLGGTWDLFRYPGIRSDSDMHTLGYRFRPWTEAKAIADGPSILRYVQDTAREHGIDEHIRYGHRVVRAAWSTADARWTVDVERAGSGETVTLTCDFLFCCSGYYRYDEGYTPELPGADRFGGRIVHPQHWPEDLDYDGRRVVVIGSGATAVTLVPAMTDRAAHVPMLHRSPRYTMAGPGGDPLAPARHDRPRGPLHDAPALAELHHGRAGRGPRRQRPAPPPARAPRLPDRALEERRAAHARLPRQPPLARPRAQAHPRAGPPPA